MKRRKNIFYNCKHAELFIVKKLCHDAHKWEKVFAYAHLRRCKSCNTHATQFKIITEILNEKAIFEQDLPIFSVADTNVKMREDKKESLQKLIDNAKSNDSI